MGRFDCIPILSGNIEFICTSFRNRNENDSQNKEGLKWITVLLNCVSQHNLCQNVSSYYDKIVYCCRSFLI